MVTAAVELNKKAKDPEGGVLLTKIEIGKDSRDSIFCKLREYGISRGSVFPDLENLGLDISRKWRN